MHHQIRDLYEMKAQIIRAVGQPIRLAIIDFLKDGEQCVCDIAEAVGAERSNVSRHLSVLLNAGILGCRKEGLKMIYSLRTPCIMNFFSCVADVLKAKLVENNQALQEL